MFSDLQMMTTSDARKRVQLLLRIARMYYQDHMLQSQIAEATGYSRPSVSRMLKEAQERGLVRISIENPLERLEDLESRLIRQFNLRCARVSEPPQGCTGYDVVPRSAASLLVEQTRPDSLITVSNGNAVAYTVREVPLQNWTKSKVVQMIGSLSPTNPMTDSPEICRMLAQRLGGSYSTLPVPMILSSTPVAAAMRKERQIADTLTLGGHADVAVVGVGSVKAGRSGHIFKDYENAAFIKEVTELKAVGHICGHHIDAQGRHIRTSLCERTISIEFERLKRIPLVIGVAWGPQKVASILACLRAGLISALATDRDTAEGILELDQRQRSAGRKASQASSRAEAKQS